MPLGVPLPSLPSSKEFFTSDIPLGSSQQLAAHLLCLPSSLKELGPTLNSDLSNLLLQWAQSTKLRSTLLTEANTQSPLL